MTKPNPNNKYPKKTKAAAIATRAMAEKNHRRFLLSAAYVMKHMPEPVVVLRAGMAKPHTFPAQPGLCGARDISAADVHAMTMAMIVNVPPYRTDLQYNCQTFLKSIKPYLPNGVVINCQWSDFRSRNCSDPECIKMADELEAFAVSYYNSIESCLAGLYLTVGDRGGSQFMKVLEKRFREHWNTSSGSSFNVSASLSKKSKPDGTEIVDESEAPTESIINFNFEVVQSTHEENNGQ